MCVCVRIQSAFVYERREIGNLMNGVSTFVLMVYFMQKSSYMDVFLVQRKMCDTAVVVVGGWCCGL